MVKKRYFKVILFARLDVVASDRGIPPLSARFRFTVVAAARDRKCPRFTSGSAEEKVREDSGVSST